MQAKIERNKKIFQEWKSGIEKYGGTKNRKDVVTFASLAKKHKVSVNRIMAIVDKERLKELQ